MGKALKIIGVLLLVAALAVWILLFTDFEAPQLGQKLVRIAGEAAGVELRADRFLLNLRKGLVLEGAEMRSSASGEQLTVRLDRLEVDCRLLSLLQGDIVVQRILLESPMIEMVSRAPATGPADQSPRPAGADSEDTVSADASERPRPVTIDELSIVDARFVSRSDSGSVTEIDDLDLRLVDYRLHPTAESALVGTSGSGRLSATGVRLDDRIVRDLSAVLEADAGRYRLTDVAATGGSGSLRVERLELDLGQDPFRYRLSAMLDDVDLDQMLDGALGPGTGPARLKLDATGEGPGLAGVVADVVVRLEGGSLPSVSVLQQVDRLLGTALDRAPYDPTEIQVSIVGPVLEVERLELVTGIARLGVSGTIDFTGEIALKVPVGLPRGALRRDDISEEVLDSLTDRDDWLTIPLAVTGTVDDPRFGPDMEAVAAATRRLAEDAAEAALGRVRGELESVIRSRLGQR